MPSRPVNQIPAWLERLRTRLPSFSAGYLQLDPRSLGLARIYIAFLLLLDLVRRVPDLATWYSNEGLLPNHTLLWRPGAHYQFSFFFTASHPHEAALLFVLCGLVYLGLLVGWRTRLFHVLALVCVVSLHDRAIILENGGDVVLNLVVFWTVFLPMGARFSIDAVRASLAAHPEHDVLALDRLRSDPVLAPTQRPAVSLAVLAIVLQVSAIYFFNAVHKNGPAWREGSIVHYVLHQDRIVTWIGWKLRPFVSLPVSRVLTYGALAIEMALPFLILVPIALGKTRRIAWILGPALHLGFAFFLNLGTFSFNMLAWFVLLLSPADWELFARRLGPRQGRARTVFFDADCGFCFFCVRVLARLDAFHRLTFVSNADTKALPEGVSADLVERTIVVADAEGHIWTRAAAFAQIFRAIPGWGVAAILLRIPGLSFLAGKTYDLIARNRTAVSVGMGLPACGLPGKEPPPAIDDPAPTPLRLWTRARLVGLRELVVLVAIVACGSQLLNENWILPRWVKHRQWTPLRMVVEYPRIFQGWSMFAPDAPRSDSVVHVDARTVDGRRIDPINLRSSRVAPVPMDEIPEFLDNDEYWCDYINRIGRTPEYHGALRDWIFAYHERTGRIEDRIVSFDVYQLEDESPPPGSTKAINTKKTLLFHADADR